MLNTAIREQIEYPEWRLLYDNKILPRNSLAKKELQNYIRNLRKKYRVAGEDMLLTKSNILGNDGGWYREKVKELEQAIYKDKMVPADFIGKWRSIEFELIFNSEQVMKDFVSHVRFKKWSKFVTVKHDGSIKRNDDDFEGLGKEVVVSYREGDDSVVREVCKYLRGKAYVNSTCGTHVHFDMRSIDVKQVKLFGARLARCVPALRLIVPKSRSGGNQYCGEDANELEGRNRGTRYAFINMQAYEKYQTLEVRGHSGTIDANKILNWIHICETIMATRIRSKNDRITTPQELINVYKFDADLSGYIMARFNKFNSALAVGESEDREITSIAIPASTPFIAPYIMYRLNNNNNNNNNEAIQFVDVPNGNG